MSLSNFDTIIVGQGLAGTSLAWSLTWNGARVLAIDREAPATSSRVAAGLVTPITGQKLVLSWRFAELWPTAVSFYRRVEAETGTACFHRPIMVRLFANGDEHSLFEQRLSDWSRASSTAISEFTSRRLGVQRLHPSHPPLVDPASFIDELGGFEMIDAGQLDVTTYLHVSRDHFARDGRYLATDLDPQRDLDLMADGVRIPRLGVTARRLIFCQGIDAQSNPWFRAVRFKPAKGEILTLRIPGLAERRVVHRGVWLAPVDGDLYRAGATYEWQQLDSIPTPRGREEIESRLRAFLRRSFEVVGHEAAVRPIHLNQYPVVGLHPDYPQLGYFNGLGSKGTLHAPYFAAHFVRVLAGGMPLDPEVDLNRRTDLRGCRP